MRLAITDDTLAPCNDATVAAPRQRHPARVASTEGTSSPPEPDAAAAQLLTLTDNNILQAIKSFPAGSAGGLDGLRPQHLKDMTSTSTGIEGQRLIAKLTEFANLCLVGHVPLAVRPTFFGATLCALNKKCGGVRPIAVGSTFRM